MMLNGRSVLISNKNKNIMTRLIWLGRKDLCMKKLEFDSN